MEITFPSCYGKAIPLITAHKVPPQSRHTPACRYTTYTLIHAGMLHKYLQRERLSLKYHMRITKILIMGELSQNIGSLSVSTAPGPGSGIEEVSARFHHCLALCLQVTPPCLPALRCSLPVYLSSVEVTEDTKGILPPVPSGCVTWAMT